MRKSDELESLVQQLTVTGKVTDSKTGDAIPGVNIVVQGTTAGAITDGNGSYSINVPGPNSVLVFSFISYISQSIIVSNQSVINVALIEEVTALEEVVVIGYGTQRKVNLTGSVSSVGAAEITKRPAINVQNLLQGKVTGLQVTQSSGLPGADDAMLRIRGVGTFSSAGSDPLVLIDGVKGNMNNLNPNDIETVSVLKDAASSAIYGARAANGVILITTKRGIAQDLSITYNVTVDAQKATRLPKLLTNSADYMQYFNEANIRAGMLPYFTQEQIDGFRNNPNDPVNYPNFDWIDHSFHTALTQTHHLSVNGGNDKTVFNLTVGYADQGGVTGIFDFEKYNIGLSVDTKVKDWITIGGTIQTVKKDILQSNMSDQQYVLGIYGSAPNYTPTMTLPDGTTGFVARYSAAIGEWTVRNPDAISASGYFRDQAYNVSPQLYTNIKIIKDLTWLTKGAITFDNRFTKRFEHESNCYYFNNGTFSHNNSPEGLGVRDNMYQELLTTFYSTLNYHKVFNAIHNFNILACFNQETYYYRQLGGTKITFPTYTMQELNAGSATGQTTSGTANEWAIQSIFGRLTYDYNGKYMVEANARYDGTSRIAPDTRWGFFPSVSAGWRLSEESFLKQYSWMDNLKLRASWGQLGNQNVGNYPYQDVLSSTSYPFSTLAPGQARTRLVDKTLKWETTSVTDLGIDISVKNGLFSLTADWFNKITDDILYGIPVPASVGLSSPTVNGGKMKNTGFEFELGHRNKIGEFDYNISFNLSSYKNEVLNIIIPTYGNTTIQKGQPYNSFYLIEWIGIFQNQGEIDAGPKHPYNPKPGDLKYKDQLTVDTNGDGIMDATDNIIDSKDRVVVPGAYPKFYYGGSINVSWKNFDLSAFLQGVEGPKILWRRYRSIWLSTIFTGFSSYIGLYQKNVDPDQSFQYNTSYASAGLSARLWY